MSRRDQKRVKADTVPKVTENLGFALIDIQESESLKWIAKDDSSLDVSAPGQRTNHFKLDQIENNSRVHHPLSGSSARHVPAARSASSPTG